MASVKPRPSELYDHDYYAWIQDQVRALRERRIEDVDWEKVAEEIEDLGKSEKRALKSQLAQLLEHLLKLEYAPARLRSANLRGWQVSVRSVRRAVAELLHENPSLQTRINQVLPSAYLDGRDDALGALNLPDSAIPEAAPWSFEQVMDDGLLPRHRAKAISGGGKGRWLR